MHPIQNWLIPVKPEKNINIPKDSLKKEAIRVVPTITEKLSRILEELQEPYHYFWLLKDKLPHVIIREIPDGNTDEEIRQELKKLGFHPADVSRMKHSKKNP